jgi:hypothetical protein
MAHNLVRVAKPWRVRSSSEAVSEKKVRSISEAVAQKKVR